MNATSSAPVQPLRQWLRNVGAGYGDTVAGAAIFILLTPFVVRRLGVEAYAAWVLSHSITFYLKFFDLGFNEAQVRLHARFAERARLDLIAKLVATAVVCLTAAGALAALTGGALAFGASAGWLEVSGALESDLRIVIAILAINLLVSIPGSALETVYDGAQRFDLLNLRSIILRVVGAGAQLVLLLRGHGIVALALTELAVSCLAVAIDLIVLRRLLPGLLRLRIAFDRRIWRRIRHFALWMSIDDIVAEGTSHLDELLVAVFLPLALLTPYALCLALAGAIVPIIRPITETFFPMAAALHARHATVELARLLAVGTKVVTAIALPLATGLVFFGQDLLAVWVPEAATASSPLLIALLAANVFVTAMLWTCGVMLLAVNRIRFVVALNVAEVVVEVALIVLLAPRWGLTGVAAASLAANVTLGLFVELPVMCRIVKLTAPALLGPIMARLALAAVPLVLVALLLRAWLPSEDLAALIVAAVALGTTWLAALFVLGTSHAERTELLGAWRTLRAEDTLLAREPRTP